MKKTLLILMAGALMLSAADSAKVYKQCAMCHGKKGEKVAMKSSPKLHTLEEADLLARLNAIKDGSSSISSKYLGMHKSKLKKVKLEDVEALAQYISDLK